MPSIKHAAVLAASLLMATSDAFSIPAKREAVTSCLKTASVPYSDRDSSDWAQEIKPYNLRIPFLPAVMVQPSEPAHISDAVACGVKSGIKISARGGGHSYANSGIGGEDGHMVIDLSGMHNVKLGENGVATIQPGARLGHVATKLWNQGKRALAHGSCPGVGIAGHSLHGGYGFASRTHGLTLDFLAGATVALPSGKTVHCSATENADLYWALRGAGSSFGIVTEFEFNTFEAPGQATWFTINVNWDQEKVVDRIMEFQIFGESSPKELNMRMIYGPGSQGFDGMFYGDLAALQETLKPFLDKIGAEIASSGTGGWIESLEHNAGVQALDQTEPYDMHDTFYATSLAVKPMNKDQAQSFVDALAANAGRSGWYILVDLQGGANSVVSKVKNTDTAYAHRDKLFLFQFQYSQNVNPFPASNIALKTLRESITKTMKDCDFGMYINYPDTELDRDEAQKMYWGSNLPKLQSIKAKYDPNEVFTNPQAVKPAKAGMSLKLSYN